MAHNADNKERFNLFEREEEKGRERGKDRKGGNGKTMSNDLMNIESAGLLKTFTSVFVFLNLYTVQDSTFHLAANPQKAGVSRQHKPGYA